MTARSLRTQVAVEGVGDVCARSCFDASRVENIYERSVSARSSCRDKVCRFWRVDYASVFARDLVRAGGASQMVFCASVDVTRRA